MTQHRLDSAMEVVTSTAIGYLIGLATWYVVAPVYGLPNSPGPSIAAVFTAVSLARQYAIRRIFNGRSVWAAIKGSILWK